MIDHHRCGCAEHPRPAFSRWMAPLLFVCTIFLHAPEASGQDYAAREANASPQIRALLAELRLDISENSRGFTVGYTRALDYDLADLAGLRLPSDTELIRLMERQQALSVDLGRRPTGMPRPAGGLLAADGTPRPKVSRPVGLPAAPLTRAPNPVRPSQAGLSIRAPTDRPRVEARVSGPAGRARIV